MQGANSRLESDNRTCFGLVLNLSGLRGMWIISECAVIREEAGWLYHVSHVFVVPVFVVDVGFHVRMPAALACSFHR